MKPERKLTQTLTEKLNMQSSTRTESQAPGVRRLRHENATHCAFLLSDTTMHYLQCGAYTVLSKHSLRVYHSRICDKNVP